MLFQVSKSSRAKLARVAQVVEVEPLASSAPFSAVHYAVYRQLQDTLAPRFASSQRTLLNFACGACASLAATLLTQPFDVLRTRAMLNLAGGRRGLMVTESARAHSYYSSMQVRKAA